MSLVFVGSSPTQLWNFVSGIFIHESHSCISHLHFASPYVWLRGHQQHVLRKPWAGQHPPAPSAQLWVLFCTVWLVMNEEAALHEWTREMEDHSHPQALRTLLISFDGIVMIISVFLWDVCLIWCTFDGCGNFVQMDSVFSILAEGRAVVIECQFFLCIMYIRCC